MDRAGRPLHIETRTAPEERWREAGASTSTSTTQPRSSAHLDEAVSRMVAEGQAVVVQSRLDGEVLESHIDLLGRQFLGHYLAGISPRLKALIDVSSLLVREDVALTLAAGLPRYSMLRGQEDYKMRWRPEEVSASRLLLGRPASLPAHVLQEMAQARVLALRVMDDRAPWVRAVRNHLSRFNGRRSRRSG